MESFKKKAKLFLTLSAAVGTFLASEGISENVYADGADAKTAKSHEAGKSVEAKSPISAFITYLDKITVEAKSAYENVKTEEEAEAFCKKYFDPVIEKYQPIQPKVLYSSMEEIRKLEASAEGLADLSHKLHNDPRFGDAVSEKDLSRRKALYEGVMADITADRILREIRQKNEEYILRTFENLENKILESIPGQK